MRTYDIEPTPAEWDRFVAEHPRSSILQTTPWAALKTAFDWQAERVALVADLVRGFPGDEWCWNTQEFPIENEQVLIAGAQILYRRLPAGLGRLAYVPRGPLIDWNDLELARTLVERLVATARARGALVLTIEPELADAPENCERMAQLGFSPSPLGNIQPRRTIIVDITGSEEDVLAATKSKTRYNIRLAERKGVTVRESTLDDLPAFCQLMEETAVRSEFGIHTPDYYRLAYELFVPRDWARLLLAEVESEPVAALMVFALGHRAWYFYGASGDAHREKMPSYLLQWEAIRWARSRGCIRYDLWGVPDEDKETLEASIDRRSDGLWGVYRFKRGFGGQLVRTVGTWDRPLRPLLYRLYSLALRLRSERGSEMHSG